jgi:hypothetical protein
MHTWSPPIEIATSEMRSLALLHAAHSDEMGCPPILTLRHLSEWTAVDYAFLRRVVQRSQFEPYYHFRIGKSQNGKRLISVPCARLLQVQRWIGQFVLGKLRTHNKAFGYVPKRSILDMARMHLRSRWLIKVDLTNFFHNIDERAVYRVFQQRCGYSKLVAFELARICTDVTSVWRQSGTSSRDFTIERYVDPRIGVLPQGAPTSPPLSNQVSAELDTRLNLCAAKRGLVYSRYADDLVFSTTSRSYSRDMAKRFLDEIGRVIRENGFIINSNKTVLAGPGARKSVLGLLVDSEQPRLTREFKSELELQLYYVSRWGIEEHVKHRGFRSVRGMHNHLKGKLAFAKQVDPEFFGRMQQLYQFRSEASVREFGSRHLK